MVTLRAVNAAPARRHDFDALRVLAVVVLLFYHTSRPFDSEPFHLNNGELSLALELAGNFFTPWRLPLLFVVSGAGTWFSLGVRAPAVHVRERLTRLLLPLAVGMAIVIPPQVYLERISHGMPLRQSPFDFHGSYRACYGEHFTHGAYPDGHLSWHHLWFIAYLLIFSIVALHQTVIIVVAFFVLRWPLGVLAKYVVAAGLALLFTLVIVEAIMRAGPLRPLFGGRRDLIGRSS